MKILNTLILFLKGLIIGIGKIIPGVSGSLIAISLGVYEESLAKIESIWKTKKESLQYLVPLAIGIVLSILFASKIMLHFLNTYYIFTVTVFIGLIVGTVPEIMKKQAISKKDWFLILIIVCSIFFLNSNLKLPDFVPSETLFSQLIIIGLGFVDAVTTILPGISGTATYMMLGSYNFVLNLFANPFSQLFYCILFGLGLLIGLIVMIKVVNYCFKKKEHTTWICIIGFLFSSILFLILKIIDKINSTNLFPIILLFIASYSLISMLHSE